MNKEEIKFYINEDVLYQIAMMSYNEYNDKIANANDHIGEVYSRQDIEEIEKCQLQYEKYLGEIAIKQLQSQLTQSNNKIEKIKEIPNVIDKMIYEGYMNGKEGLMATYENSEFGIRAKIIKAKLLSIIDGSDE